MENPESVSEYLDQFGVLGVNETLNCDHVCYMLYINILSKFKTEMIKEEYYYFREYQERVFDLVENLREQPSSHVLAVLEHLGNINNYLCDIIIMLWCLPRMDNCFSRKNYQKQYQDNIQKYHHKILELIDTEPVKKFCMETLIKTNNVPVHCIDYLWFYMNYVSIEISFHNYQSGDYLALNISNVPEDTEYIYLGMNMEYLLEIGLGQVVYSNDSGQKGSFRNFLKNLLTNKDLVKKFIETKTKDNFRIQAKKILSNPQKYLGDNFIVSEEILSMLT